MLPALEAQILNHWTTREIPHFLSSILSALRPGMLSWVPKGSLPLSFNPVKGFKQEVSVDCYIFCHRWVWNNQPHFNTQLSLLPSACERRNGGTVIEFSPQVPQVDMHCGDPLQLQGAEAGRLHPLLALLLPSPLDVLPTQTIWSTYIDDQG